MFRSEDYFFEVFKFTDEIASKFNVTAWDSRTERVRHVPQRFDDYFDCNIKYARTVGSVEDFKCLWHDLEDNILERLIVDFLKIVRVFFILFIIYQREEFLLK